MWRAAIFEGFCAGAAGPLAAAFAWESDALGAGAAGAFEGALDAGVAGAAPAGAVPVGPDAGAADADAADADAADADAADADVDVVTSDGCAGALSAFGAAAGEPPHAATSTISASARVTS